MGKKLLVLAILIILLSLPVYAKISVTSQAEKSNIYMDEQAVFKVTVRNHDPNAKTINVYTTDLRWYVDVEPEVTTIKANSDITFDLMLVPNVWAQPGSQIVKVNVEDPNGGSGDKVVLELPVFVKSYDSAQREYSPSIEVIVTIPEVVDPREGLSLDVYLRNRNKRDNQDLQITLSSDLFSDNKTLSFGPLEERTEKFLFDIDNAAEAGEHQLQVNLFSGDRIINRQSIEYNILGYSTFVVQDDITEALFKETTEYTVKNEGNIRKTDNFRVSMGFLQRLFTSFSVRPDRFDFGGSYIEWELDLSPMEEVNIRVVRNFRPTIYAILIVIVTVMMYFIYRSPVILKKESVITGSSEDGISELKVLLHLRNRGPDLIENLTLTDLIPSLGDYVDEKRVGTLSPSKVIKHQQKGTLLRWEFEALDPFEERIITYRIKTKMTVVGGFNLPPGKIRFVTKKGTERIVRSNRFLLGLGL